MVDLNIWGPWYSEKKGIIDEDMPKLEELLRQNSFLRVLDFGCGSGRNLLYFAKKGFQIYGFDNSPLAIAEANKALEEEELKADLRVWDMSDKLPYEDNFFDAVMSIRVFHHSYINTIKKIIGEISRITRKGGYVYVQVPTYEKALRLKKTGEKFEEPEPGTRVPLGGPERGIPHHNFTKEELLTLFKGYNIENIYIRDEHYCLFARKNE